jgi:hypothetical protein
MFSLECSEELTDEEQLSLSERIGYEFGEGLMGSERR